MPEARRGRARSESARRAILEATRDELAQHGYDKLSIDRVAAAAGAGKQTVYRWYPSKSALVAECILDGYVALGNIPIPDTGNIRRDLRDWLRAFADHAGRPEAASLIRAATAAAADNDDVAARFYERVTAASEGALTARLRTAEHAGQLRTGAPATAVAQALVGAVLYRLLVHQPLTHDFVDDLADVVLSGVERAPAAAPPP